MTSGNRDERPWLRQDEASVRFGWGPSAVEEVPADVVVVVDVLRFTTAVDAGVSRGVTVFPYRWNDASAQEFANDVDAVLAGALDPLGPSLSPVSMLSLEAGSRVVLPSPNGSTCAVRSAELGAIVVAACLRNADAVGEWVSEQGGSVLVIACGERWPDGSLRPALEDYLGAGAVISALSGSKSAEAQAAALVSTASEPQLADVVSSCVSGREQQIRGWSQDLHFAVEVGVSRCVPVLRNGGFVNARGS